MLDRAVVGEFIGWEFEEGDWEIPEDIPKDALVEAFCQYVEDEYDEWLRENFRAFFNDGDPDWEWIKEQIGTDEEQ